MFSQYQPKFHTVDLTQDGLNIEQFKAALQNNIKLIYAIPEFQNPTGLTYSAQNREEIFEIIKDKDLVLVEDDPYGELRFNGKHLPYIGAGRFKTVLCLVHSLKLSHRE